MMRDKHVPLLAALLTIELAALYALPLFPAEATIRAPALLLCVVLMALTAFRLVDLIWRLPFRQVTQVHDARERLMALTLEVQNSQVSLTRTVEGIVKAVGESVSKMEADYGVFTDGTRRLLEEHLSETRRQCEELLTRTECAVNENLRKLQEQSEEQSKGYQMTLSDIQSVSDSSYRKMSETLQAYGQDLKQQLVLSWDASIDRLGDRNAEMTASVSENLRQRNAELLTEQAALFQRQLADSAKQYDQIIAEHLERLQKQVSSITDSLNASMERQLDSASRRLETYGTENATRFSQAMESYREQFVEANAAALAEVQHDAVRIATEANKKIIKLASESASAQLQIRSMAESLSEFVTDIRAASEDSQQQREEFAETLQDALRDYHKKMLRSMDDKLTEHRELFQQIASRLETVEKMVQDNTSNYQDTLTRIMESQREMNSLTSKDLSILDKLVNKIPAQR